MQRQNLSRRELLEKCLALGVVGTVTAVAPEASAALWQRQASRKPTPPDAEGPFYKEAAPENRVLRSAGDPGLPLSIAGQVFGARGSALPGAVVEVWQADHLGRYDVDGYRYRARLKAGPDGGYSFETVMPGHYPGRICQHIHYRVTAPGHKLLVTQLYFATDPVFEGDPDKNYSRDPIVTSRALVRPVMLVGDPKDIRASVLFEPVLESL
jgi:protocatechuate 3,4-dioxygenase beta subunit